MTKNEEIGARLKQARIAAGFSSAREAAASIGVPYPTYTSHENGTRGIVREQQLYSRRFKVSLDWLMNGKGSNSLEDSTKVETGSPEVARNLALSNKVNTLQVVGTINAGSFKDISMLDDSFAYEEIQVPADHRFPLKIQYALKVEGDSMNLKYPDGTYVTVVGLIDSGIDLKAGMTVHVERSIGGGQFVETTLKEIQSINGQTVLVPRSTNPIHKQLVIEGGEETEVQIKGVVTGSFRPEIF